MSCRVRVLILIGVMVVGLPVYAHHSVAAVYDEERTLTLEGEVTSLLYTNPHSFVHLQARDRRGNLQTWSLEWWAAHRLRQQGLSEAELKPGDRVIVCGNPGRDSGAYRLRLLTLARPSDGLSVRMREPAARVTLTDIRVRSRTRRALSVCESALRRPD